ncbi:MAG: hypothetical protein ACXIVO_13770 [Glycocaulis sp.]
MSLKLYCKAMQADLRSGEADGSAADRKLILMKFCDEASDDGRVPLAFAGKVSNARLAMAAMCSEESVKRHKRQLVKERWLVPDGDVLGGRGRAARYKVNLTKLDDAAKAAQARLSGHTRAAQNGVSADTVSPDEAGQDKGCQDCPGLSGKPLEKQDINDETVSGLTPFENDGENGPKGCQLEGKRVSVLTPNPVKPSPPYSPPLPAGTGDRHSGQQSAGRSVPDDQRPSLSAQAMAGLPAAPAVSAGQRPDGREGQQKEAWQDGDAGRAMAKPAPSMNWPDDRKALMARGLTSAAAVRCEAGVLIATSRWTRDELIEKAGSWLSQRGYRAVTFDGARPREAVHLKPEERVRP